MPMVMREDKMLSLVDSDGGSFGLFSVAARSERKKRKRQGRRKSKKNHHHSFDKTNTARTNLGGSDGRRRGGRGIRVRGVGGRNDGGRGRGILIAVEEKRNAQNKVMFTSRGQKFSLTKSRCIKYRYAKVNPERDT